MCVGERRVSVPSWIRWRGLGERSAPLRSKFTAGEGRSEAEQGRAQAWLDLLSTCKQAHRTASQQASQPCPPHRLSFPSVQHTGLTSRWVCCRWGEGGGGTSKHRLYFYSAQTVSERASEADCPSHLCRLCTAGLSRMPWTGTSDGTSGEPRPSSCVCTLRSIVSATVPPGGSKRIGSGLPAEDLLLLFRFPPLKVMSATHDG